MSQSAHSFGNSRSVLRMRWVKRCAASALPHSAPALRVEAPGGSRSALRLAPSSKVWETVEQHRCPRCVGENPQHHVARRTQHLTGDQHHVVEEATKFHASDLARRLALGQAEPEPDLQIPGQTADHHVRPVGHQTVRGYAHRLHAVLELLDEVLLVAPRVALQDYL